MIDPALPPACYTEKYWFDLEKKNIFERLWIFVGLTQQLSKENDFIVRDVCGIPVLVQRMDGEIHAYHNACIHRGMPLQVQESGNRKMICPYHGWSYHADGRLRGVPNEAIFNLCGNFRNEAKLKKYKLELIGSFIFINLDVNPIPISDQFSSDLLELLRGVSLHFDRVFSYTKFDGDFNWKLNFENVLDWNHAQFVHQKTLAPLLSFDRGGGFQAAIPDKSLLFTPGSAMADLKFSGEVNLNAPIHLKDISRIGRSAMPYTPRWFSSLLEKAVDPGAFFACNIFPNVNFGSIHGEHFYVQQFSPVAPGKIEFHSWVFTAKLKENLPAQPHLLWGIHHAEKRVIDEDFILLGALQKALAAASTVGVLGNHEASLAAVGTWYMNNVKE